jgi:hypothetical protein
MRRDAAAYLAWLAVLGLCLHYGPVVRPFLDGPRGHLAAWAAGLVGAWLAALAVWRWSRLRPPRRAPAGRRLVAVAAGLALLAWWQPLFIERLHLFLYGVLGWLGWRLAGWRAAGWRRAAWAAGLAAAAGLADEAVQHLHPERVFDLRDVATNAASAALVVLAARALHPEAPGAGRA